MLKPHHFFTLLLLVALLFGCAKQEATFSETSEELPAATDSQKDEDPKETTKEISKETSTKATASASHEMSEETTQDPGRLQFNMVMAPEPNTQTKKTLARPMNVRSMTTAPGLEPSGAAPSNTELTPPTLIPAQPQTYSRKEVTSSPETIPPTETASIAPTETDKAYEVVRVFYGTDRKVTTGVTSHPLGRIPWAMLAMATGVVTLLSIFICIFWIHGKKAFLIPLLLLFISGGFAVASVMIPSQTKPDIARTDIAYDGQRGEFELGTCEVSIPKTHQVAELESPSVFRFEISEDPNKHVVLLGIDRLEEGPFLQELRETIEKSEGQEAFVFIHGYNVTFENAARRTAQLAYDLKFKGAPIFFSWPSQGSLLGYTVDENNVTWAVPDLKNFLKMIAEQSGAKRVHLVAHSMGNRALTAALEKMSYSDAKDGPLFNEVILTAPDIDAEIFRRDLAPRIVKTAQRVTLYASSNDEALIASKKVHGYPRAGESGAAVVVVPGVDTIDVSGLDTSLLGHSYFGSNDTVLTDMAQLMLESKPPTLRNKLRVMTLNGLSYWVFLVENLRAEIKDRAGTSR